jgi:hypothetical protein
VDQSLYQLPNKIITGERLHRLGENHPPSYSDIRKNLLLGGYCSRAVNQRR